MQVYKFGGASVCTASGVHNLHHILTLVSDQPVFVVVSAMGKTTDALERVLTAYVAHDKPTALNELEQIVAYHAKLIDDLGGDVVMIHAQVEGLWSELKVLILDTYPSDYDRDYDQIVSYGELISTRIISSYLHAQGLSNTWLDMRSILRTDSNHREANVQFNQSERLLRGAMSVGGNLFVGQGFIGGNSQGHTTTLGREGSDYSAALVAHILDAQSVTIWKDVPGILNADPRIFDDTVLIPELTYYDAVELSHSGAQVIHPKTIKPLENKNIPLYVKPFGAPTASGSVIKSEIQHPISVPVRILRKNQLLITVRPLDFSFVVEDSLSELFAIINKNRLKVALIQSSAVTISVCVDHTRYVDGALDELRNLFRVSFNADLELLTIRGTSPDIIKQHTCDRDVLLMQHTRRMVRVLMRRKESD